MTRYIGDNEYTHGQFGELDVPLEGEDDRSLRIRLFCQSRSRRCATSSTISVSSEPLAWTLLLKLGASWSTLHRCSLSGWPFLRFLFAFSIRVKLLRCRCLELLRAFTIACVNCDQLGLSKVRFLATNAVYEKYLQDGRKGSLTKRKTVKKSIIVFHIP